MAILLQITIHPLSTDGAIVIWVVVVMIFHRPAPGPSEIERANLLKLYWINLARIIQKVCIQILTPTPLAITFWSDVELRLLPLILHGRMLNYPIYQCFPKVARVADHFNRVADQLPHFARPNDPPNLKWGGGGTWVNLIGVYTANMFRIQEALW